MLVLANGCHTAHAEEAEQPLPLYADRYYYGLHIYAASLTQTAEDTVCFRATVTNHSGSYVPPKDWWLCFYDKYANLTFMVPGGFGDVDSGCTQTLVMYKNYLTPQEVERCLNDTYTYRFFGQGTDEVDSFVNPNIVDFPEGTVLTTPTGIVNITPRNTPTPIPTHAATASPAPQNTATPIPTHAVAASPVPQNTATPSPTPAPVSAKIFSVKSLRVRQATSYNFSCKLRWKKHPNADAYAIYRSSNKKGAYQILTKNWKKTCYIDNKIKAGMRYYYQVIPYKKGQALESCLSAALKQQRAQSKQITISKLKPPSASFSKRKTAAGQRYIEIKLKKYQGNILQIYIKKNHSYQNLSLKNPKIQKRNKKFRILYQQGGVTLYFKLRTYKKTAGKRPYSLYSKEYKMKL